MGSNVYVAGTGDRGDRYIRTTEAIADYVGRVYSPEMWSLVQNREETEFVPPEEPEGEATTYAVERYKGELTDYRNSVTKRRDKSL